MKNPTMLYKAGGKNKIHGGLFDYIVVDGDDNEKLERSLSEGWFKTTEEAESERKDSAEDATHCPTCGKSLVEEDFSAPFTSGEADSNASNDVESDEQQLSIDQDIIDDKVAIIENPLDGKTREELESIAEAMEADHEGLNIAFNARTSDESLAAKILEAKKSLESSEV